MEKEGTHNVIDSADDTLGFTVLLGGVWACESYMYTMSGGEGMEFGVVELTAIIHLDGRES